MKCRNLIIADVSLVVFNGNPIVGGTYLDTGPTLCKKTIFGNYHSLEP